MVLGRIFSITIFTTIIYLLSGCSGIPEKKDSGIIPVQSTSKTFKLPPKEKEEIKKRKEREVEQVKKIMPQPVDAKKYSTRSITKLNKQTDVDSSLLDNTPKSATTDTIVESLLIKAKKAQSLKQWLRAQDLLEHAIRLKPKEASIFLLYGDVYTKMGVIEQAKEMYRRAIFLSNERNETYRKAVKALETISSDS